MATFTIELRDVIDLVGKNNVGLGDYPIFDEEYRKVLNERIIDHYWYYEIAHETVDQFIRQMRTKMREEMPAYNKLYMSTLIDFDPLITQDIRTTNNASGKAASKGRTDATGSEHADTSSDTASKSRAVSSEMPQTRLAGDEDYATAATDSVSDNKTTGTSDGSSTQASTNEAATDHSEASESRSVGYTGSGADLVQRYRDAVINVDMMVIDMLKPLFMGLWNNGDNYSGSVYDGLY